MNHFWQGSRERPANTQADFDELWVTEHFVTLIGAVLFGASGLIESLSQKFDIKDQLGRQNELTHRLQ